jgi:hypothetical protein|tara:strand:+ start:37 stop:384 length:348 start_codon:yes stop_codon:yes gene_type:complete
MKTFKLFTLLVILLSTLTTLSQDLPIATIDEKYYVTLPNIPVQEYYYVDISHLDFEDKHESVYLLTSYVTANLISNQVFYEDGYMVIRIHLEHIPGGEVSLIELQNYLNHLTKPE